MSAPDWPCEAYGPEGLEHGARCFMAAGTGVLPAFSPGAARVCGSPAACHENMAAERQRVFQRIQELAAGGDPIGLELAEEFTSPEQLLGGDPDEDNR